MDAVAVAVTVTVQRGRVRVRREGDEGRGEDTYLDGLERGQGGASESKRVRVRAKEMGEGCRAVDGPETAAK